MKTPSNDASAIHKLTSNSATTEDTVMEAIADLRISCNIPRNVLLSADSAWTYKASIDSSGFLKGIESIFKGNCMIDVSTVCQALRSSNAVIQNHFSGMPLFRHMFPVPMYDDPMNDRKAFAVFINKSSSDTRHAIDPSTGKILAIADPLRVDSNAAISPLDPSSPGEIPIVTAMNPISVSPMSSFVADSVLDAEEQDMGILILSFGEKDIRVLHHDVHEDGTPLLPLDNFGNVFIISPDLELMFPPNRVFTKDTMSYTTMEGREAVPDQLSAELDTGHVGMRILQVMAHYFSGSGSDTEMFNNPGELADSISDSVANTLNNMLAGSAYVRQAVLDQMYKKIGMHMFVLDGSENPVSVALTNATDTVSVCVPISHPFKIGSSGADSTSTKTRNVALKNLPIIINLV